MTAIFDDIRELLYHVDETVATIEAGYTKARKDDEQEVMLRPVVKSVFSDLRSVLDYSAGAIYKSYSIKGGKIYFPYAKDERVFVSNFRRNLNGLEAQRPDLYDLLKSVQPFVTGREWLLDLCHLTNETKHNSLGKQKRQNSDSARLSVGNLFKCEAGGRIILNGVLVNGVPVGVDTPFEVSHRTKKKDLERVLGHVGVIEKEYDWVRFECYGTSSDILDLLRESRSEIGSFVSTLEKMI